jgi:hypothetical protein
MPGCPAVDEWGITMRPKTVVRRTGDVSPKRILAILASVASASLGVVLMSSMFGSPVSTAAATATALLWPTSSQPGTTADPDSQAVEVGTRFLTDTNGWVSGIRFYKATANSGTHTASLWSSTGTKLASGTFRNEPASGWTQLTFSRPAPVVANAVYTASYFTSRGHYSVDEGYFNVPRVGSPLSTPRSAGVYRYGSAGYPTSTYGSSNYWVTPMFSYGVGLPSPSANPTSTPSATSSPIQTATPTSSGMPRGCIQNPSTCGYPDETSTGVPAGTSLAPSGGFAVRVDGTVISGLDVRGTIDVYANNVTVENTRVTNSGDSSIGIFQRAGYRGLALHSVTIRGADKSSGEMQYAIRDDGEGMVASRVNMYNCADCVQTSSGSILDSYIHDMGFKPGDHTDGFQSDGGGGVVVRHNTIINSWGQTSAVALFQDFARQGDDTIDSNLLAGGGYTIYGGAGSKGPTTNIRITNNRFSRIPYPNGGSYGPVAYFNNSDSGNLFTGNVWDDTGVTLEP